MATRFSIATPNLPIAPKQYEQRYQEQLNNVQRLFYNGLANAVNLPYPYGSFTTGTASPTNPVANVMNLVSFTQTETSYNTKIGAVDSRIYVAETAVYNVQFSAQCNLTSGALGAAHIWIRQNGVNVPSSTGKTVVSGPSAETVAAWNYFLPLQANDYIELAWASSDTHLYFEYLPATSVYPEAPAVALTVSWVSSLNNSVGQG
jgi:hypothetical protein